MFARELEQSFFSLSERVRFKIQPYQEQVDSILNVSDGHGARVGIEFRSFEFQKLEQQIFLSADDQNFLIQIC